jgi:hypothetical protein
MGMRTNQDIEGFFLELGIPFDTHGDGMWVLHDEEDHVDNIVAVHNPPVLTLRVKVMEVPRERRAELFEQLLKLNATEMVHGAYGIEDDSVVIVDGLQSPNLDLNELRASIENLVLAITSHYEILGQFRPGHGDRPEVH